MEFVFEERKKRGGGCFSQSAPEYPAFRVTEHKEKKSSQARLYFVFNIPAVELARWIDGDSIVPGCDFKNRLICFKRESGIGFRLSYKNGRKKRSSPHCQASYEKESSLAKLCSGVFGTWIRLSAVGALLVSEPVKE